MKVGYTVHKDMKLKVRNSKAMRKKVSSRDKTPMFLKAAHDNKELIILN